MKFVERDFASALKEWPLNQVWIRVVPLLGVTQSKNNRREGKKQDKTKLMKVSFPKEKLCRHSEGQS